MLTDTQSGAWLFKEWIYVIHWINHYPVDKWTKQTMLYNIIHPLKAQDHNSLVSQIWVAKSPRYGDDKGY